MLVGEIPEQTAADVEQKLKTMSGGEFDVPGGVPRGAGSRGPQFTPPQRFATFALRLGPFAWEFCDGAPVCSQNDAFRERNGDLNLGNEHRSAAKTMPGFGDAGTCTEIIVSLQTGTPLDGGNATEGTRGRSCRHPGRVPWGTLFLIIPAKHHNREGFLKSVEELYRS